jgi:hypothetical protein
MTIRMMFLIVAASLGVLPRLEAIVINASKISDFGPAHEGLDEPYRLTNCSMSDEDSSKGVPYWEHVGMVGLGSGVYLGDGYVLTSAHVGCHPFLMANGTCYRPDYKTWRILTNPTGEESDLAIFRVNIGNRDSGLSKLGRLPIREDSNKLEGPLVMIGTGYIESRTAKNGEAEVILGYRIKSQRAKRWGVNFSDKFLDKLVKTAGGYETHCFVSNFDRKEGEAQAADGDSGGATFAYNRVLGRWELAGCIIAASQLQNYVPFGARTYLGDLGAYRDQIPGVEDVELPAAPDVLSVLVESKPVERRPDLFANSLFGDLKSLWSVKTRGGGGLFLASNENVVPLSPLVMPIVASNP